MSRRPKSYWPWSTGTHTLVEPKPRSMLTSRPRFSQYPSFLAAKVKLTLPWLPLGTYSFTFAAKTLGYWEKRGLDVSIDRGFGSTKVCVPVDQGQYDFGLLDMAVMAGCAGRGLDLVAIAGI